jgi:hypothetical protein
MKLSIALLLDLAHGYRDIVSAHAQTKTTRYEALEKNAVSEPKTHQITNLQYSLVLEKLAFAGGISAHPAR